MSHKKRNAQAITSYDVVAIRSGPVEGQEATGIKSLGLVWRTADDSDNSVMEDSDDDYLYDDEDLDLHRRLEKNNAEVVWLADEASRQVYGEVMRKELDMSHLKVVDRCMQQGDVVASADNPLGQSGIVLEVTRDVDVMLSTGQVLERQPSTYLQPELIFQPGQHVLHKDGWFGRIDQVNTKVTVAFESGALVELTDFENYERCLLRPAKSEGKLAPTVSEASEFYPGQHVLGDLHLRGFPGVFVLRGALHTVGSQPALKGIVVKVEVHTLKTTWLNTLGSGRLEAAPQGPVQPSGCTPVTHLYYCPAYWHLGTIGLWRGEGANKQQGACESSQVKAAEKGKRGAGAKLGRIKGLGRPSGAAAASNTAAPSADGMPAGAQSACPNVQQLSLDDQALCSENTAAQGGSDGAAAPKKESEGPVSGSGATEEVVAECISSILDEVTPEQVAAQGRAAPQANLKAESAQEQEQNDVEQEGMWSSLRRRGWGTACDMAAIALMGSVMTRPGAPAQDVPATHGTRRSRHGGKKRGRGRRAHAAQAAIQLKDLPVTAQVLRTYTRVTVQWQDGTIAKDVDSAKLLPVKHTDEHDFYPNSFVSDKVSTADLEELSREEIVALGKNRIGLVQKVDHAQRTATVVWHSLSLSKMPWMSCSTPEALAEQEAMKAKVAAMGPTREEPPYEEVVSVYSIMPKLDYDDVAVGNVVARLDFRMAAAEGRLLGSVGSILRVENFSVHVHWLDGTESTVGIEEVFVIGHEEDLDYTPSPGDDYAITSDSEFEALHGGSGGSYTRKEQFGPSDDEEDEDDNEASLGSEANPLMDTILHVHGSIRREAEDMNDAWRAASDIDGSSPRTVGEGAVYEEDVAAIAAAIAASEASVTPGGTSPETAAIERPPSAPQQTSWAPGGTSIPEGDYGFPHFEVTEEDPTGFENMPIEPASTLPSRGFQRAVLKEWDMLREGLPATIWVRAFESRMDVLRAAILGAAGTPYHDQLFVFDIQLSPDHPSSVPRVLFHSHGNRINPNLYEDGKVCLSLLNTWNGRRTEQWDPSNSTILQVLVSIQGLILVPEPYFNEAGYEKQVGTLEGERNSVGYNESAFLATIRTTMSLLRSPPAPFKPLLQAVFQDRRERLLRACNAYVAGTVRIGAYSDDSSAETGALGQQEQKQGEGTAPLGTTQGFQLVFKGVMPRLEKALKAV